jgi:asparagine synthase (glutamine-hydrolysing)
MNPLHDYPPQLWTLSPQDADKLYTDEAKSKIRPMRGYSGELIEPFDTLEKTLYFERFDRLTEYHCNRLDRMTMAQSLEARVPFLDRRVIDFALQLPYESIVGASGKQFLQAVARPFLPDEILYRPKAHFPSLVNQWTSGKGSIWASEILLDNQAQTRKWIKADILSQYISEHNDGRRNMGRLIWALVTLELWLRNPSKYWDAKLRS